MSGIGRIHADLHTKLGERYGSEGTQLLGQVMYDLGVEQAEQIIESLGMTRDLAFQDIITDPSTSWFEGYDDGWKPNKRNRVDWSSGYLRNKPQDNPHFTIEYITNTGETQTLEVGPCVFSGVKIQSNNNNLKRPYFGIAFRGPDEERGEMYTINTGSTPTQTASTVVRMDYDPEALGSWTVEITDAYLVDISDINHQGIIGLIKHVTFVITRIEKV